MSAVCTNLLGLLTGIAIIGALGIVGYVCYWLGRDDARTERVLTTDEESA